MMQRECIMGLIGQELKALDTPVLWVDLDQMEKNILHFSNYFKAANLCWRPHIKGVKIPALAHKMIAAGAIGVNTQVFLVDLNVDRVLNFRIHKNTGKRSVPTLVRIKW